MSEERIGIVKWFNEKKGYGFIIDKLTNKEYFVHFSAIDSEFDFKKLMKNWLVRFTTATNQDGSVYVNWVRSDKTLLSNK
jgi:CspA family cold shock protein